MLRSIIAYIDNMAAPSGFKHAQNVRIHIILRMRIVLSGTALCWFIL